MGSSFQDFQRIAAPLHAMHPCRFSLFLHFFRTQQPLPSKGSRFLKNETILDVGCGDGINAQTCLEFGAKHVTAIDPSADALRLAQERIQNPSISWHNQTLEKFCAENMDMFSLMFAFEVFEHIPKWPHTLQLLSQRLVSGGYIVISTLNRTLHSFASAIVGAELLFNILPKGTHTWSDFITPAEICLKAKKHHLSPVFLSGLKFYPISQEWRPCRTTKSHFLLILKKTAFLSKI